jgi:hypothetical protein
MLIAGILWTCVSRMKRDNSGCTRTGFGGWPLGLHRQYRQDGRQSTCNCQAGIAPVWIATWEGNIDERDKYVWNQMS